MRLPILPLLIASAIGAACYSAQAAVADAALFAHVASDPEWVTQIFVVNPLPTTVPFTLTLHADSGGTIALQGSPSTTVTLQGYETAVFETAAATTEMSGWAAVTSNGPVDGIAIFRRHASDGRYYEGSVELSEGYQNFAMPFDETTFAPAGQPFVNGFAITNFDSGNSATVNCSAMDTSGNFLNHGVDIPLNAGQHTAFLLDSVFGATITGHQGTIVCHSNTVVAAVEIRSVFGAPMVSSMPVIPITIQAASSIRYKDDVKDMAGASADLMRLRPVTFRYKLPQADGSHPLEYGLIAEEVQTLYPSLVTHGPDGQARTVKYEPLIAMLLNELQRQNERIAALEQRVAAGRSPQR